MNQTAATEFTAGVRSTTNDVLQTTAVLTALATAASTPDEINGYHHVTVPYNYAHKDITEAVEKAQPAPNRKRGSIKLKDVASLLAYCKDQDAAATAYLYADTDRRLVTAIFNDQRANAPPGWRDHRAAMGRGD